MRQSYQSTLKYLKNYCFLCEIGVFVLRLLLQRIFSVYIGLVIIQILLCVIVLFKSQSQLQSKLYIVLDFVLMYLLMINYIEYFTSKEDINQQAYKQKFLIINYIAFIYPIEFVFRLSLLLMMWRIHQYSVLKNINQRNFERIDEI